MTTGSGGRKEDAEGKRGGGRALDSLLSDSIQTKSHHSILQTRWMYFQTEMCSAESGFFIPKVVIVGFGGVEDNDSVKRGLTSEKRCSRQCGLSTVTGLIINTFLSLSPHTPSSTSLCSLIYRLIRIFFFSLTSLYSLPPSSLSKFLPSLLPLCLLRWSRLVVSSAPYMSPC